MILEEIRQNLVSSGENILKYYDNIEDKHKTTFYSLFMFNETSKKYIIDSINQIEHDKILPYAILRKNVTKMLFSYTIYNKCDNMRCEHNEKPIKSNNYLKVCPKCKSGISIDNEEKLNNTIKYYLSFYSFYILSEEKESIYLVNLNYENKYYIKKGNQNLKDSIYYLLKHDSININYLAYKYGNKIEQNLLFDYIQANNLIMSIDNINFYPSQDRFIENKNNIYFNTYTGNKYLNLQLSQKDKDKFKKQELKKLCPNIYYLLSNLSNSNEDSLNYLINYLSFVLCNPNMRTEKVISFFGEEETGKGIFYNFILNVLFEGYCSFISMKELEDDTFNEHYENKLFVFVDESYYKKIIESMMLNYATCKSMTINHKHGAKKPTEVFFNFICASNKEIPMKVGKRRSVYFRSKTLGGSRSKAGEVGERLVNNIPNEINDFAYYLKSLDVSFKTINKGCDNSYKEDINNSLKTIEERFVDEMFSYKTLNDFIVANTQYSDNISAESYLSKYLKEGFLEYNLFLDMYNKFRLLNGINSRISLNKFTWFCNKLDIDKNNTDMFKRGFNDSNKNVFWINKDLIVDLYKKYNI